MHNFFENTSKILNKVVSEISQENSLSNNLLVPVIKSIHLSVGAGKFFKNAAEMEKIQTALTYIAGQKAVLTTAKKSVAAFDVREGMKTGVKVTLRRNKKNDFLDRLKIIYLPRMREWQGFDINSFNGRTFSFGLKDSALVFPEIVGLMDTYNFTFGMNITIIFNKCNIPLQKKMMEKLGFPFKN